jgi:hypothetical protein
MVQFPLEPIALVRNSKPCRKTRFRLHIRTPHAFVMSSVVGSGLQRAVVHEFMVSCLQDPLQLHQRLVRVRPHELRHTRAPTARRIELKTRNVRRRRLQKEKKNATPSAASTSHPHASIPTSSGSSSKLALTRNPGSSPLTSSSCFLYQKQHNISTKPAFLPSPTQQPTSSSTRMRKSTVSAVMSPTAPNAPKQTSLTSSPGSASVCVACVVRDCTPVLAARFTGVRSGVADPATARLSANDGLARTAACRLLGRERMRAPLGEAHMAVGCSPPLWPLRSSPLSLRRRAGLRTGDGAGDARSIERAVSILQ